jgi:hypothetical protein
VLTLAGAADWVDPFFNGTAIAVSLLRRCSASS